MFFVFINFFKTNLIYAIGGSYSIKEKSISPEKRDEIKPLISRIDFLLEEKKINKKDISILENNIESLKLEKRKVLIYPDKFYKFQYSNGLKTFHLMQKKHFFKKKNFLKKRQDEIKLQIKVLENVIEEILHYDSNSQILDSNSNSN
ncbi:hypothetical protein [Candidatus Phytoplasma oryzae]|nr:hypothetical protein [Candidatus Phytoplasma oryzae]